METKRDCSFPCLVFLTERSSGQTHELPKTSESDYVFCAPNMSLKQDDPHDTARERETRRGAFPNTRTNSAQSVGGLVSQSQYSGDTDPLIRAPSAGLNL